MRVNAGMAALRAPRPSPRFLPMTESAAAAAACWLSVLVPTPAYSAIGGALTYSHSAPLPAGTVVRVPLGRREVPGDRKSTRLNSSHW